MNDAFVTEAELGAERSPNELTDWVARKFQEIAHRDGGKEAVRMRKGFCKQLVEEVYPLSIFASLRFSDANNVKFRPVIGNQKYDALITDYSVSPPRQSKLEITQAHEGETEFLRRLMLQEQRCGAGVDWAAIPSSRRKMIDVMSVRSSYRHLARNIHEAPTAEPNMPSRASSRFVTSTYRSSTPSAPNRCGCPT